jgi:NADPH:quinone reductase-like Zn-dependent oxidoreductase
MDWDLATSLSIRMLTAFPALKEASLKLNVCLIVFGASWNTGMMALQFGKKIGAKVIGVSKQHWITDFGADYVIGDYDKVVEKVDEITGVLNSIGVKTWDNSFASVGVNGRLVTYGILTRADVKLNIQSLYYKQIKLIGATGGNRKELQELLTTFSAKDLKVKVWKKFSIQDGRKALEALSDKEREGRILVEIKS